MKRWNIFLFAAVLLVLSACAPAKGATAEAAVKTDGKDTAMFARCDVISFCSDIQQPVLQACNALYQDDHAVNEVPAPPDYPELGIKLAEPVSWEYRDYFYSSRSEKSVLTKWNGYALMRGRDLPENTASDTEIDPAALYLYNEKAEPALRVCRLPVDGAADDEPDGTLTYGHSLRRAYCLTDGGRTLTQINPATGEVRYVYRSDSALRLLAYGREIMVFAEQTGDDTCRTLRLFEPDGTVDVLEENLPWQLTLYIISNDEFATVWPNPEMTRLCEPLLPELSGDAAKRWVWARYGVPDWFEYYCNTLTGYHKTMAYSFYGFQYFFLDGTPWEGQSAAKATGNQWEGLAFWLYLPSDD